MNESLCEIAGPWKGRLAVVPRPRGGDWLEDDLLALRSRGVDVLVSLLTPAETGELDLGSEATLSRTASMDYINLPIEDRGVPATVEAAADLARGIGRHLARGQTVALHCRSGIGRSTLLAACVLAEVGVAAHEAFERIERARGVHVPDTEEQREWVERFARQVSATPRQAAS